MKEKLPQENIQKQSRKTTGGKKKKLADPTQETFVFNSLGIPQKMDLGDVLSLENVKHVTFNRQAPVGLSIKEVERFCDYVESSLYKIYKKMNEREKHLRILAGEIVRLQGELSMLRQESSMFSRNMYEEERETWISEINKLKSENKKLKEHNKKMTEALGHQVRNS